MEEKITCIYGIYSFITNKFIYIGQTKDFKNRKNHHFGNKYEDLGLFMYEQGRKNFDMFIIKRCKTKEERLKLEDYYINYFKTIDNGFNKRRSGYITKDEDYAYNKSKRWYENNKEYSKERSKQWQKDNKERFKNTQSQWYENNKEKRKEWENNYYSTKEYKEKHKLSMREYRKTEKYKKYLENKK